MKKEFLSNIILILALNFLVKPIYIIAIDARVQNLVGTENYGLYFALVNFCFLFQFFLDLGIQNYTSKSISEKRTSFIDHFGHLILVKLILALLFVILVMGSLLVLGDPISSIKMVGFIVVQMILLSFVVFVRANLSALGYYRWDSILSSLDKGLLVVILGYLLWFSDFQNDFTLYHFIIAQIIALFFTLIIASLILILKKHQFRFSFSITYTKSLLKKSFPYALVLLLMSLYTRMDGVMLERLLDDNGHEAGVYAAGYRIMDALNMLGYLFATLLLPMFAHIVKPKERNELFDTAYSVLFTLVIVLSVAGFLYSQQLMDALYIESNIHYGNVFSILMFCFTTISLAYIFGSMITATGKLRNLNYLYGSGIVINWILNLILIPQYLATGAAIATLITQGVVLIGLIWIAKSQLKLEIQSGLMWKSVLFALLTIIVFYAINQSNLSNWYYSCILSVIICMLLSFSMGFMRLDIIQMIKRK